MQIFRNSLRRIIRFLQTNFFGKAWCLLWFSLTKKRNLAEADTKQQETCVNLLILWICRFNRPADGGPELHAQAGQDWQDRTQDCRRKTIENFRIVPRFIVPRRLCANISPFYLSYKCRTHKVHLYLMYHSVCSFVRIGTPTPPLPPASVPPPLRNQMERGHTRLRVKGWGWVPIRTIGEKA